MPGYNVHRLFNYTVFIGISLLLYVWNIDLKQFLALSAGYYIGTEFITPDLDTDSAAINKWGMLRVLWLPYKWLFRHGQSSHNLVYGASVRILYLSIIIFSIYYFLFKSLPPDTMFSSVYAFVFLIGIIVANALHVIMDILL